MSSIIAKKQVNFIKPQSTTTDFIKNHLENAKYISIARKDAHLIDTAMISDKMVASNDDIDQYFLKRQQGFLSRFCMDALMLLMTGAARMMLSCKLTAEMLVL